MKIATILFTYDRSWHTRQVLEALSHNTVLPEKLYIFQDGLKKETHRQEWENVKELIHRVKFCDVEVIESEENKGLAKSIITGIDYVFDKYDAVIILEDDCVPAPSFMVFMKQAFEKYQDEKKVYSVSGYAWPIALVNDEYDAYFNGRSSSWGWGTWKDRWQQYKQDKDILSQIMSDKETSINLALWGKDLDMMLCDRLNGKNDSWAVFWSLEIIKNGGVCLCPFQSLIRNIGCDGSGVHCGKTTDYDIQIDEAEHDIFNLPMQIEIKDDVIQAYTKFNGSLMSMSQYNINKEDILVYGMGKCFHEYENVIANIFNIIAIVDANRKGFYAGQKIISMDNICKYDFNKIVITLYDIEKIEKVTDILVNKYGIQRSKIVDYMTVC